jgi:hypothetical protein
VLIRVGNINPSNKAIPNTVGTSIITKDIGKLLLVITRSRVILNIKSILLKGLTGDTEATVIIIARAEPS